METDFKILNVQIVIDIFCYILDIDPFANLQAFEFVMAAAFIHSMNHQPLKPHIAASQDSRWWQWWMVAEVGAGGQSWNVWQTK